jgi:hypothetical protein
MKFKSIQDLKFFFPTSRTPINHNFQSAGRKILELDIITDYRTTIYRVLRQLHMYINSVHHDVPSSLFLVQPSSQAQLQLEQVHQAFRQAWYLGLHL